jgi:AcrR family transcriptional regulator
VASAPAQSQRVRAKRERRREEILRSALRAFRRRGYHRTTLDHIASSVGIRKTALYHYFLDKEEILYQCHCESLGELSRILREASLLPTVRERLRHLIREHVRVMTDTLQGSPLAFEVTALSPRKRQEVIAARDRYEGEVRGMLESGIRDGVFRPVDAKVATFAILGAINWIARWYRPEGALDGGALGDQFAAHLLDGLGAGARKSAIDRRAPGARASEGERA